MENEQQVQIDEQVEVQESAEPNRQPVSDKKYSDADLDKIINSKYAKWRSDLEKEQAEANRVAKMSADEKVQHELAKREERIAELEAQILQRDVREKAVSYLADKGLPVNDDVLALVVKDSEDDTIRAIEQMGVILSTRLNDIAAQSAPRTGGGSAAASERSFSVADFARQNRVIKE